MADVFLYEIFIDTQPMIVKKIGAWFMFMIINA